MIALKDVVRLGRQHIRGGRISIGAMKGGKVVTVPIAPQLKAVIDAHPSTNITFLVTAYGKPFTANGFGNWFCSNAMPGGSPSAAPTASAKLSRGAWLRTTKVTPGSSQYRSTAPTER